MQETTATAAVYLQGIYIYRPQARERLREAKTDRAKRAATIASWWDEQKNPKLATRRRGSGRNPEGRFSGYVCVTCGFARRRDRAPIFWQMRSGRQAPQRIPSAHGARCLPFPPLPFQAGYAPGYSSSAAASVCGEWMVTPPMVCP